MKGVLPTVAELRRSKGGTFEKWMHEVDRWLYKWAGLSYADLADCVNFRAEYEAGTSASSVAKKLLRAEGFFE